VRTEAPLERLAVRVAAFRLAGSRSAAFVLGARCIKELNRFRDDLGYPARRLPTEKECEYAARAGTDAVRYG